MEMTSFLVCPRCRGELVRAGAVFNCRECATAYPVVDEVPQFDAPMPGQANPDNGGRDARRDYWNRGWEARFQGDHAFLSGLNTRSDWAAYLAPTMERLRSCGHVSCVEARPEVVDGKVVLDIGCGGGTTGAIFAYGGAHYIGLDHSSNAAVYSLRHLKGVGGEGFTVQGNAESLPIRSNSIDIVYSNGVLHHTPNFATAMDEVYRVLKPGGTAIIALYATYSTQFGVLRLLGILKGRLSRAAIERWMGEASEGDWRTADRLNPWTETFSEKQLRKAMRRYNVGKLTFRKNGSPIGELPRIGASLSRLALVQRIDRGLEPWLGSMLVMSFGK